ncbi:predicted protein [Naegleria gruberi]|uniref:Predicted protein n=1 Tax=Naegleria gruberi TaxID=5762 RepID=D2VLA9_NAEGR|nr:uncharacterized protein NAEGRDRAFT_50490 [Naegleria gruberi]EFC42354.1 predicted protein [Naegleria gruberi]|eukprot:XP_002675098.1 predicted protein [Naegleria gruberi strain NEG-M]
MIGITIESSSFSSSSSSAIARAPLSARGNNSSLNQSHSSNPSSTPRGKIVPNSITREVNSPIRNYKTSPIRSSSNSSGSRSSNSPIRNNNKWASKKGQSEGYTLEPETRRRSISEEIITLRDDNSKLRREMDNMKLLLNCQKEENFFLSTSLFSAQEELKKLKTIIKKRESDIREQQEKMESLISHSVDMRPRRETSRSPNSSETQVLKKELELLRAKLKASEEKFEKLKMINKETEDNVECLLSQLEHQRVTKDQLLDQAKNSILSSHFEKEKNDSFRIFLDLYQENNKHVGDVELEDKYEQLLLAKQDLETKLFKREEQLIEMTMKFESARCDLIKNSIM